MSKSSYFHISKDTSRLSVMSYVSICSQNFQDFCFIVLDSIVLNIFHAVTTSLSKNIAIALAITLVRQAEELTQIGDVVCSHLLYDCAI